MKADEVLKLLEKHERECNERYAGIQKQLDRLDVKMWGLAVLIISATFVEKLFFFFFQEHKGLNKFILLLKAERKRVVKYLKNI